MIFYFFLIYLYHMYTKKQQKVIDFTENKVRKLFKDYRVAAHGFGHTSRVRNWAVKIAQAEKADVFICELAAWLHDIGRTKEKKRVPLSAAHHELSYQMCQGWFRREPLFKLLTKQQKLAILYAVRYHWNDAADKYKVALILRDADKFDALGQIGVKRAIQFYQKHGVRLETDLRLKYYCYHWLRTKTAQKIAMKNKMTRPAEKFLISILKKQIKPVAL